MLEQWHVTGDDLATMEQDVFGWDHAAIGARMCVDWTLPEAIQEAMSAHHADGEDGGLPAVSLVSTLLEIEEHRGVERRVETTYARFALPKDQTNEIVAASFDAAGEIAALFA